MSSITPSSFAPSTRSRDPSLDRTRIANPLSLTFEPGLSNQPSKSSLSSSSSSQTTSARYFHQFQTVLEKQRHAFDEERALWQIERLDLLERINELESILNQRSPASILSPGHSTLTDRNVSAWSTAATNGSRIPSSSNTGEEVWRGSVPSAQPTRTFSDSSNPTDSKQNEKLPSIAEDEKSTGKKISFSENDAIVEPPLASTAHKPSIHGSLLSRSLDGIYFKSSGLPPSIVEKVSSPIRSPTSPSDISPNTPFSPPRGLQIPLERDPYTKDAGHTPLARHGSKSVGLDGTGLSSASAATPVKTEIERPPLESRTTQIKVPSERHDSYFPTEVGDRPSDSKEEMSLAPVSTKQDREREKDDDPTLTGPLGLTNEKEGDGFFLSELDSKLNAAANEVASTLSPDSQTLSPPTIDNSSNDLNQPLPGDLHQTPTLISEGIDRKENLQPAATNAGDRPSTPPNQTTASSALMADKGNNEDGGGAGDNKVIETPDSEPRLRIKRSMNFGSAFGEKSIGPGF